MGLMWRRRSEAVAFLAAAALMMVCMCGGPASAMRFQISGNGYKCFSEDLHAHAVSLADYRLIPAANTNHPHAHDDNSTTAANAPDEAISVAVVSPHGDKLHSEEQVREGKFAFTADDSGDYTACFWIPGAKKDSKASVDLDWKVGIAAKDWDSVAKREKLEGVELELAMLHQSALEMLDNLMHLRLRQEKLRSENEVAQSRIALFSVSSLSICVITAGLQVWYLKRFFLRQKLL